MRIFLGSLRLDASQKGFSGMSPQLLVGGDRVMCRIETEDETDVLAPEKAVRVRATLPYGESFPSVRPGESYVVCVASAVLGRLTLENELSEGP